MRVEQQACFILHTKPYRETSLLLDVFTQDHGKLSVIAKGVRAGSKKAKLKRSQLQLFIPLSMSWTGRSKIKTLVDVEATSMAKHFAGEKLYCGFYINELILKLLPADIEYPDLFQFYRLSLHYISESPLVDVVLRRFELTLLESLGYGINFLMDNTGLSLKASNRYKFDPTQGFIDNGNIHTQGFAGSDIIELGEGNFTDATRMLAKQICRHAISYHLGNKTLNSRKMYQQFMLQQNNVLNNKTQ